MTMTLPVPRKELKRAIERSLDLWESRQGSYPKLQRAFFISCLEHYYRMGRSNALYEVRNSKKKKK